MSQIEIKMNIRESHNSGVHKNKLMLCHKNH